MATATNLQNLRVESEQARHDAEPVAGIGLCRDGNAKGGTPMDKPWNDVTDQLRPAWPEIDDSENDVPGTEAPDEVIEADPADVADQRRVVPLPDDEPDAGVWP